MGIVYQDGELLVETEDGYLNVSRRDLRGEWEMLWSGPYTPDEERMLLSILNSGGVVT